jgi:hypothetical protein
VIASQSRHENFYVLDDLPAPRFAFDRRHLKLGLFRRGRRRVLLVVSVYWSYWRA